MEQLIRKYCCSRSLNTHDPYDIWKTEFGFRIKHLYNRNRLLGSIPAGILALADSYMNPILRLAYRKQEFSVVRALAAQILLNLYENTKKPEYLEYSRDHLDWLVIHSSTGYSGSCWGIGFDYPVARGLVYDKNTPFTTNTPYPLEAFVKYSQMTGSTRYFEVISSVYRFFKNDIPVIYEDETVCVTAYGPFKDRIVTNAVSYTMFSLALLLKYLHDEECDFAKNRIMKLYNYIVTKQNGDGAWFYSPEGKSFIDCFHTCFVLKNIIKADRIVGLEGAAAVVEKGYSYLKSAMYDEKSGLFRRFSVKNKPGIIKFDLYDNAEALILALLVGDFSFARQLKQVVTSRFVKGDNIYSQIDNFGFRKNRNTLRWAAMPYLYAISEADKCMR